MSSLTRDQWLDTLSEFWTVEQNSEGYPRETLVSGIVSALDFEEERIRAGKGPFSEEEFDRHCAFQYMNMGYHTQEEAEL